MALRDLLVSDITALGFHVCEEGTMSKADLQVVNETHTGPTFSLDEGSQIPTILLSTKRGDRKVQLMAENFANRGATLCHRLYKPILPSEFRKELKAMRAFLDRKNGFPVLDDLHSTPAVSPAVSHGESNTSSAGDYFPPVSQIPFPSMQHTDSDMTSSYLSNAPTPRSGAPASLSSAVGTPGLDEQRSDRPRRMSATEGPPGSSRPNMPPRSKTVANLPGLVRRESSSPRMDSLPPSPGSMLSMGSGNVMLKSVVASHPLGPAPRILVVEDNEINRKVLAAFMRKRGWQYVETEDGLQGVQAFRDKPENHFDVILMDVSMPNLDGISATAQIRKIESQRAAAKLSLNQGGNSEGYDHAHEYLSAC